MTEVSPDPALTDFIAGLPKAELHVHQVGSASPRIVAELAARNPGTVPSDLDELADFFRFRDFAHFIEVYLAVVGLIRTGEDVRLLTYEVAREMAQAQQVRYAELTCTPFTSVRPDSDDGIAIDEYVAAIEDARVAGLHSVPHAGETTGPQTILDALRDLGAERIGHGTSAAQDPALLDYLVEHQIPLEVCPSSNIATGAVASLSEHPLPTFRDAGVRVSINSDDPPMFATTLNHEYAIAAALLDLDRGGVADLARSAVDCSFADESIKKSVHNDIDAYTVKV